MIQRHCIVVASGVHEALARHLCTAIEAPVGNPFHVEHCALPWNGGEADLLVPIVDAGELAALQANITIWRARHPSCSVVPVTIGLSEQQLLGLLSAGAFDFVDWPSGDEVLCARLQRAVGRMPTAAQLPLRQLQSPALRDLVGSSPAFLKQLAMLPTIAGCDAGVMILGETGSGKEVYARAIHYSSARSTRALVTVNCGAIPSELIESELFGHVRGAFTNAYGTRPGLVREAEGGTLFLDEIDSLPALAQAKLLRFLQEKEYRQVGGDALCHADVRVITASNQDLPALAERGQFRRDLFFRLHVLMVTLPPLRERAEDICVLALRFLRQFAAQNKRPTLGLSPQAVKRLLAHDWPGNVRELKHVIERAVLMTETSIIQVEDLQLPSHDASADAEESFRAAKARMVDAFERSYIERLLASSQGNITQAAQMAKKNRRAFFELIRKHGISSERFRDDSDALA